MGGAGAASLPSIPLRQERRRRDEHAAADREDCVPTSGRKEPLAVQGDSYTPSTRH